MRLAIGVYVWENVLTNYFLIGVAHFFQPLVVNEINIAEGINGLDDVVRIIENGFVISDE